MAGVCKKVTSVCHQLARSTRPGQLVAHRRHLFADACPMGSILYMLEAPEVGGDTMWASLQDAYDFAPSRCAPCATR